MLSVITPHYSGTNPYIEECYGSLRAQTLTEWEWVIVLNHGGILPEHIRADGRVRVVESELEGVGALKRCACENATGEVVVELDADDMLTPDALAEIAATFDNPETTFAYSNDAQFEDGTWKPKSYSSYWGWVNRPWRYQGHDLVEQVGMPATAQALRTIFWTPNHVRAWRARDYWQVGGHNPELAVVDDYDLCCRFYLHAPMTHIDKCLYLYRAHPGNTTKTQNGDIQAGNAALYSKYVIPMAECWAVREELQMIDLGGGISPALGYTTLDREGADIECDLEQGIPLPDNSVGVVRAYDVLEHLHNPVMIMNEIYRVLAPGGWLTASIPSTDGRGAFQDPTHVSFWNANSFWYYTNPDVARYVSEIQCQFQVSRVITWYPSAWHKKHEISYVDAQLIAVKPGYTPIGECLWPK